MEKRKTITPLERREETLLSQERDTHAEDMSLAHIQKLVHLLDRGDIAEIELNRADTGLHLALRKLKVSEHLTQGDEFQPMDTGKSDESCNELDNSASAPPVQCLKARTVGIFHSCLKPHGKILVTAGDLVKVGQIVGAIETLSIITEVEADIAGRVIEILVQDGQPVEYGQDLMSVECTEGRP